MERTVPLKRQSAKQKIMKYEVNSTRGLVWRRSSCFPSAPMRPQIAARITLAFLLLLGLAHPSQAGEQKLGFAVDIEGEGFFLNPIVTKIRVSEVIKGSLAETAGMRTGDLIIQIEGRDVAGKRALELRSFMKFNTGETRTLRLKHADGTEVDIRITKPRDAKA
jgi:S1-C subfamily serine protease